MFGWTKSKRVTWAEFFRDRKKINTNLNNAVPENFLYRISTNDNWAINLLCVESTTQEDYKNQGPVGQSPNGSRGDNFLQIEKTEKSSYQKSGFLDVELQQMIIGQ